MSCFFRLSALAVLIFSSLALVKLPNACGALVFETQLRADFQFNIFSTGPLGGAAAALGLPTDQYLDYTAIGRIQFTLDDSNPTATSWQFTNATGSFNGIVPPFPYTISPNLEFVGGTLANIVRNGANEIISAEVQNLSMRWNLVAFPGTSDEVRLFGIDPLPFSGSVTGVPFAIGDVLAGPQPGPVDVYLDVGGGNSILAASVQSRFLTAVPEPTSLALIGLGLAGAFARRRIKARS